MRRGLEHALRAGELLIEAKAGLAHGQWLPWLKENCSDVSERSAQNCMRMAREVAKLEPSNAKRVADLSFRDALQEVAAMTTLVATKTDDEVRELCDS